MAENKLIEDSDFSSSDEEYDVSLCQKPYYVHPLAETHFFCSDKKVKTKKEYFKYQKRKIVQET